jgi:4,5-dihydroxyphthalate decarboxylase
LNDIVLTYAGLEYFDQVRPLFDGTVRLAGISLRHMPMLPAELFRRVAHYTEFDIAEFSASTYMNLIARGDKRYIAIPVFPSRSFRHRDIFVHRDSGIRAPGDLVGKRVGIPEYQMTAGLWQRAALMHDYGVMPQDLQWFLGGITQPGYVERNATPNPPGVSIEIVPDDRSLEAMLADGELDALLSPVRVPPAAQDGSGRVRRLFPDYVAVEQDYYRRTGFFPIMHLVVLRRDVHEQYRWVAGTLLDAFSQAQAVGWRRMLFAGAAGVMLPWLPRDLDEIAEVMGPAHWPYGFQENYATLDAMCQFHLEQGLSSQRLKPEELFAEETHETPMVV